MWKRFFRPCYCADEKQENTLEETGIDRLKEMFSRDDYGLNSPQIYFLKQNILTCVVITGFCGGFSHMIKAKEDYFRRNVASTFESQFLAKRKLTDTMTLVGAKGGFKSILKYGSFSSIYLICTTTAATYNNKVTIYEHIGTGALLGALSRVNFGLKGMAVSAGLGAVLGTIFGGIFVSYLWLNNLDFQELLDLQRDSYYQMRKRRPAHNF